MGGKMEGSFSYHMYWFILLLATFATVVFGVREHDGYLDYECITGNLSSSDKLPVILLHGLTDSKETWDGLYQNIPLLTGRTVCIYDARNHGDSPWNKAFDIDDLAEELRLFMDHLNIHKASLVGHSMGALTIMKFALNNPSRVESIFVEDISPKEIPEDVSTMFRALFNVLLDSISAIPPHADPTTAVKVVMNYVTKVTGQPPPEYLFKRFPFRRCYDRWQWKANFELFIKILQDTVSWIGRMEGLFEGGAFFIYGTASPLRIIQDEEFIRMLFPKAEFFGVEGAGHLIHQDFPIFFEKLIEFLNQQGCQTIPATAFSPSSEISNSEPLQYTAKSFFQRVRNQNFEPLQDAAYSFFQRGRNKSFEPLQYAANSFFQD